MSPAEIKPLPQTCKAAVVYEYGQDLHVEKIPTPQPVHGAVVVKVEATPIYGPWRAVFASNAPIFVYPRPFTPGGLTVGRVAAIGPDTTTLEVGQLVLTDYFLRARDNPDNVQFLRGAMTFGNPVATKLADALYRGGGWAEYMLVTHENCHAIDEKLFLGNPSSGGLGWTVPQLSWLAWQAICYSGLRDIELQAGETVVILPATGVFGGAAVEVASAMGARVVAGGRNINALQKLADRIPNVKTVRLTGEVDADSAAILQHYGRVECYLDLSSPTMPNLNHTAAGLASLATYGRASIMGGQGVNIPINYGLCVGRSLTLKGRFMYSNNTVRDLIKLAGAGGLKPGNIDASLQFPLTGWKESLQAAEEHHGWGKLVSIVP